MDWLFTLANWFGSAVCHQWDSHSYIVNGVALPLCARCTGMYLGALLTLAYLSMRARREVQVPRPPYLFAFFIFFLVWAVDGVNSFLSTLRGVPFLYEPQNLIRLTTGMLMGLGLGTLLFLLMRSFTSRIIPVEYPPLFDRARDFFLLLLLAGLLVVLVNTQWALLSVPLTALLLAAILVLTISLGTLMLTIFLERAPRPDALRRHVLSGALVTILFLSAIALARAAAGLSFEPPL